MASFPAPNPPPPQTATATNALSPAYQTPSKKRPRCDSHALCAPNDEMDEPPTAPRNDCLSPCGEKVSDEHDTGLLLPSQRPRMNPTKLSIALSYSNVLRCCKKGAVGADGVRVTLDMPTFAARPLWNRLSMSMSTSQVQHVEAGVVRPQQQVSQSRSSLSTPECQASYPDNRKDFLTLPDKFHKRIYGLVFVAPGRLDLAAPSKEHFRRCAAFLRSCSLVYEEGCRVHYGQNEFLFRRRPELYGSIWRDDWEEIGFKQTCHFLKRIGPINTGSIRKLDFQFDDAPVHLHRQKTFEQRRFVWDGALLAILWYLGNHGRLESLRLCFHGRKSLRIVDEDWITILRLVKTDSLRFERYPLGGGPCPWGGQSSKHAPDVERILLDSMVRREKMYPTVAQKKA